MDRRLYHALALGNLMSGLGDDAWRFMRASSAIPALLVLFMRFGTPSRRAGWSAAAGSTRRATSSATTSGRTSDR